MTVRFVEYVNRETLSALPPCDQCGSSAEDGRHTSPSPDAPCRDGFPAGPAGCANPDVHHLYRLPASFLSTREIDEAQA